MFTDLHKYTWNDIKQRNLRNYTILLDVDGVLMSDGEEKIPEEIIETINILKENNDLYIVSNTIFKKRCRDSSSLLNIPWINSPFKKPNTKILKYIPRNYSKPIIMIGDKFLTDWIFAKLIKAEPILIKRRLHKNDHWFIKFTYIVDDFIHSIFKLF